MICSFLIIFLQKSIKRRKDILALMPKITRDYQEGYCDVCRKETLVRVLVNNHKVANICKECVKKNGKLTINQLLKKFGEDIDLNAS
jgi:hypothetical protein